jgi:hypothetical protein
MSALGGKADLPIAQGPLPKMTQPRGLTVGGTSWPKGDVPNVPGVHKASHRLVKDNKSVAATARVGHQLVVPEIGCPKPACPRPVAVVPPSLTVP